MKPEIIRQKEEELILLCKRNPNGIPIKEAAEYLNANPEGLRRGIENGTIKFGFSWQKELGGNHAYKIPVLTFYNYITAGYGIEDIG